MSMMNSLASMAMDMSASKLAVDYSVSVAKKVMDTQELAAQEMLRMLPAAPAKGAYIDTYA